VTRLALRRGTVVSVTGRASLAELEVDVAGEVRRAVAYTDLTGPVREGDDVLVNTAGMDLGLGSGGFDVLHANLTRGLDAEGGDEGAHVIKLNYSSLQHAVHPLEERAPSLDLPLRAPVAVIGVHGQLACVAWAAGAELERAGVHARIGFVQTAGGALPGALSNVVRDLRERGLLAGHVTAAPSFGGEEEAITTAGGVQAAVAALGWDAVICGPGPGILGSATALGHGGLAALDSAHAALALGCPTVVVPRMSSGDPRPRHRGLSHHTAGVLGLLLAPVTVALPEGEAPTLPASAAGRHRALVGAADLEGYRGSGLPARTMGRGLDEDELFFRAALAGGSVLARHLTER
jgi:hypothetical protein